MKALSIPLVVFLLLFTTPTSQCVAEEYVITLKGHGFIPQELAIPAGKSVTVTVKNENSKPMEFESHALKREKIIGAGKHAVVKLGPLEPGKYEYFDEFQESKARAYIIVE